MPKRGLPHLHSVTCVPASPQAPPPSNRRRAPLRLANQPRGRLARGARILAPGIDARRPALVRGIVDRWLVQPGLLVVHLVSGERGCKGELVDRNEQKPVAISDARPTCLVSPRTLPQRVITGAARGCHSFSPSRLVVVHDEEARAFRWNGRFTFIFADLSFSPSFPLSFFFPSNPNREHVPGARPPTEPPRATPLESCIRFDACRPSLPNLPISLPKR